MAGSTQVGKAVLNPMSLINQLSPRDGISHGTLIGIEMLELVHFNRPWLQAQDLGLHRDAALWQMNGRSMFTLQELQARKQIWWACVRADKCVELELYLCTQPRLIRA